MTQDYKIILTALDQTRPAFEQVQRSLGGVGSAAKSTGMSLAAIGGMGAAVAAVGISLSSIADQFNKVVDSAAGLKSAAERTGSTVEQMGALSRAAKLTGTDFALVETSVIKLTKSLFGADEESGNTARALASIGLSVKDLRALDPAEAFKQIGQRLNGFADSADKTAVAMALFGKSGAQVLPFLKDLAELGDLNSKITAEQAFEADQYQKNMMQLTASFAALYTRLAMDVLPAMREFTGLMVEGQKAGLGLFESMALGYRNERLTTPMAAADKASKDLERMQRDRANSKSGNFISDYLNSELDKSIAQKKSELAFAQARLAELDSKSETAINEKLREQEMAKLAGPRTINFKAPAPAAAAGKAASVASDPLSDAAKSYGSVMTDLSQAQTAAMMSGMELTATQRRLVAVMTSPEWLKMPEPWRALVAAQGEAAIAAEQTAAAEKRLNDLINATPTAKLEAQRETMQFLAKAYEDFKISADQFQEASQAALGTLPNLAKDGENAFADLQRAIEGWGRDSASAIVDFATTGKLSFSGMVESMIKDLMRMIVYQNITKPLAGAVSGSLPGLGSLFGGGGGTAPPIDFAYLADGGVAQSPSLSAYSGGVYNSPQMFAFARGAGIFGEAGPEAIMPLQRGRDGKLGVAASGGGGDVTVNVTVAADGSSRNDGSGNLAALGNVIAGAVRAELINQKRPGGLLAA